MKENMNLGISQSRVSTPSQETSKLSEMTKRTHVDGDLQRSSALHKQNLIHSPLSLSLSLHSKHFILYDPFGCMQGKYERNKKIKI